jgi:hypothetical protein
VRYSVATIDAAKTYSPIAAREEILAGLFVGSPSLEGLLDTGREVDDAIQLTFAVLFVAFAWICALYRI